MSEATRSDLPKGREAQCPICWRVFGSDSSCETHKPYRRPVSVACKDPASLGMVALERRGVAIWVIPMPETARNRLNRSGLSAQAILEAS